MIYPKTMSERKSILRASRLMNQQTSVPVLGSTRMKKRASFSNKSEHIPELRRHNIEQLVDFSADLSSSGDTNESNGKLKRNGGKATSRRSLRRHSFGRSYPDLASNSTSSVDTSASNNSLKWYSNTKFFEPSDKVLRAMKKILKSKIWQVICLIFTVVLLFGGSAQLYFNRDVDVYFDAIYIVTMVILLADIFMMVYIESAYFALKIEKCNIQVGSFKFWFDLIAVLSLIFNLSAIAMVTPDDSTISLTDTGEKVSQFNFFYFDSMMMLAIILRTAKVARCLRIQYVLDGAARFRIFLILAASSVKHIMPKRNKGRAGRRNHHQSSIRSLATLRNPFKSNSKRDCTSQILDPDVTSSNPSDLVRQREQAAVKIQIAYRSYRQKLKSGKKRKKKKSRSDGERLRRLGLDDPNVSNISNDTVLTRRRKKARKDRSQIGLAMNDKLTNLFAVGIILAIALTILFTFQGKDMSQTITVLSLHNAIASLQENPIADLNALVEAAFDTSVPILLNITFNDTVNDFIFVYEHSSNSDAWTENIRVDSENGTISTEAFFDITSRYYMEGYISFVFTVFLILIWIFGLILFAGPVTYLVVIPIERMIRLLSMLVKDPLGYDNSKKYKQFASEEHELAQHTRWTSDNLKGMETQFLMETILCTGSLMKVGFGSAGAKIIKNYLKKSPTKKVLMQQKGIASTVNCIFMFCDIRQFTDATECLQDEVFLFTNKIATVVHSICHSFGGAANKNIGDAFLLSWKLDEPPDSSTLSFGEELYALENQADKALVSVVRICIALCYETYYTEDISEAATSKLKKKFEKRPGNLIQIGFGLHAGKAVEGAIGSRRKLDATYLGNAVELAETLESSTKKYGVSLLLSGQFYKLLHNSNQRRCRQIDEMFFILEYEADDPSDVDIQEDSETHMRLFTCDIDLEALRNQGRQQTGVGLIFDQSSDTGDDIPSESVSGFSNQSSVDTQNSRSSLRQSINKNLRVRRRGFHASMRRMSFARLVGLRQSENNPQRGLFPFTNDEDQQSPMFDKLVLPTGTVEYSSKLWQKEELRIVRSRYNQIFFQKFNAGFQAYLTGKWNLARSNLEFVKRKYGDKPSEVLLEKMQRSNFIPPHNFRLTLGKE